MTSCSTHKTKVFYQPFWYFSIMSTWLAIRIWQKSVDDAVQQVAQCFVVIRFQIFKFEGSILSLYAVVCMNSEGEVAVFFQPWLRYCHCGWASTSGRRKHRWIRTVIDVTSCGWLMKGLVIHTQWSPLFTVWTKRPCSFSGWNAGTDWPLIHAPNETTCSLCTSGK